MNGPLKNNILPCLVLFSLSCLLYAKATGFGFIPSWDDAEYVIDNIYIRGFSAQNLEFIFTRTFFSNYAPLHLLSYAIDFSIWELDPAGYHLTNIIIHGLNSCLVYLIVSRITGLKAAAFIPALMFALHPLNVENVAWVAERKTLLTSFFSFLSVLSYLAFRDKGRFGLYLLCVFFFMLALLSKPLTVTLPLIALAYEAFIKKEFKAWPYLVPLFAVSLVFAVIAFKAHSGANTIEEGSLSAGVLFGAVYPTMLPVYWKYIGMIVWPSGLSGFYDTPVYGSFLAPVVAVSLLGWAVAFALVFWKGTAQVRFWFLWFWIWLLPVSNIIPIPVYYADRYMYLPAIGAFVLFSLLLSKAAAAFPPAKKASVGFALVIAVFFASAAFSRLDVWKDEISFWEDTVKKSPAQDKARLNLGYAYEMSGRFEEAEQAYIEAIKIYPSFEAGSNLEMVRAKKAAAQKGER